MSPIAVISMVTGYLIQNYAEWRGGGPDLPNVGPMAGMAKAASPAVKATALQIISVVVVLGAALALIFHIGPLIDAIAAALVVNALGQCVMSFRQRRLVSGTLTGAFLMLPASVWVIATSSGPYGVLPLIIGPVASFPILYIVWRIAFRINAFG